MAKIFQFLIRLLRPDTADTVIDLAHQLTPEILDRRKQIHRRTGPSQRRSDRPINRHPEHFAPLTPAASYVAALLYETMDPPA